MSPSEGAARSRESLTSRQRSIIQLLTMTSSKPITVAAIAEKLNVSTRTVLREMPAIEQWFSENDFQFSRKPGVGLMIHENRETVQFIRELLETEHVRPAYHKRDRRRQILGELLSAKEPVKSYVFLSRFHISEGTLSSDLDELGKWLAQHDLTIVRKPGTGIYLEGDESGYRSALSSAAFDFIDQEQILNLLRRDAAPGLDSGAPDSLQDRLLNFIEPNTVSFVEKVLLDSEKKLGVRYTDSAYMALVVHLSLTIRRIESGEKVEMDPDELQSLRRMPEFAVAEEIVTQIRVQMRIEVPEDEIGYITMHLCSARIWPRAVDSRTQLQTLNARQIVMSIVSIAEQELNLGLRDCDSMIEELVSHMDAMISRLTMNLHLGNSQTEVIQQNYPDIYRATERACDFLKDLLQIDEIPPSEIAYVAMHFVAAAEKLRSAEQQISVVVVCPTGVGASRMLAANLVRSFQNIEIHQVISAFGIDPIRLREEGVDLILSTVALQVDFPTLVVSPILQAQDKVMVQSAIDRINRQRTQEQTRTFPQTELTAEGIRELSVLGTEIYEMTSAFYVFPLWGLHSKEDLMDRAAGLFAETVEQKQAIADALSAREHLAHTYIPGMGIYLMHCATSAVKHCRAAYIRLHTAYVGEDGEVQGVMLLLLPEGRDQELRAQVLGRVSILLVEEPSFLETLQTGESAAGRALLEQSLARYYQGEYEKRAGPAARL